MTRVPLRSLGTLVAAVGVVVLPWLFSGLDGAPGSLAEWSPAAAVATAVLLLLPAHRLPAATMGAVVLLIAGPLLTDLSPTTGLALGLGTALEVLVVTVVVTRGGTRRPALVSWGDFRRWLIGIAVGTALCGVVVATAQSFAGEAPWRAMLWVFVTQASAQVLVLPLFVERHHREQDLRVPEVLFHVGLLMVVASLFLRADPSRPVSYLLLPLLVWSAARFPPRWTIVELYTVCAAVGLLTGVGVGSFRPMADTAAVVDIAASAPTFVIIATITTVCFSLATGYLRDSLHRNREHEVQLGQLLESANGTAFIATDLDGTVTFFSQGAEQLTGYRSDDLVGTQQLLRLHDPNEVLARSTELDILPSYDIVTHAVRRGALQETKEWTYVRRSGGRIAVSVNVTAVRDASGAPTGFLSVVRDITDRRAAERALVQALDKERETIRRMLDLDRAKSDFVSSVSHELRTPLTSIIGYTELLRTEVTDELTGEQQHLVERIDRNSGRLLHLVEDLLTLAKVEDGQLALETQLTDLRTSVRGAVDDMSYAAHKSGVSLGVELPDHPVVLLADPPQIERLVLNLVGNAVKFTPRGGTIGVTLRAVDGKAVVEVSDTGVGIPADELDRLFARFFRSSTATANAIQGTGLGLSIVRTIAEAHGGTIGVRSEVGVGTTFTFTVPLPAHVGSNGTAPVGAQPVDVTSGLPAQRSS